LNNIIFISNNGDEQFNIELQDTVGHAYTTSNSSIALNNNNEIFVSMGVREISTNKTKSYIRKYNQNGKISWQSRDYFKVNSIGDEISQLFINDGKLYFRSSRTSEFDQHHFLHAIEFNGDSISHIENVSIREFITGKLKVQENTDQFIVYRNYDATSYHLFNINNYSTIKNRMTNLPLMGTNTTFIDDTEYYFEFPANSSNIWNNDIVLAYIINGITYRTTLKRNIQYIYGEAIFKYDSNHLLIVYNSSSKIYIRKSTLSGKVLTDGVN
jgi:hypothetical protein